MLGATFNLHLRYYKAAWKKYTASSDLAVHPAALHHVLTYFVPVFVFYAPREKWNAENRLKFFVCKIAQIVIRNDFCDSSDRSFNLSMYIFEGDSCILICLKNVRAKDESVYARQVARIC